MKLKASALTERISRARSALHCDPPVRYRLGRGGFDPGSQTPGQNGECDCSGFIAWCLGLSRDQRKKHGMWISTTDIAVDANGKQRLFVKLAKPEPGCIVVYPDREGRQGHVALVTQASPLWGIDCSAGRNGIAERSLAFFQRHRPTYCALRQDLQ